jgi:hypothetical protein
MLQPLLHPWTTLAQSVRRSDLFRTIDSFLEAQTEYSYELFKFLCHSRSGEAVGSQSTRFAFWGDQQVVQTY